MYRQNRHIQLVLTFTFISLQAWAIVITPPTSASDYQCIASLIVSSFDSPAAASAEVQDDTSIQNRIESLRWNIFGKTLTEDYTYRQYVRTARRMRGKKYCLLVAKEYHDEDLENGKYDVVGMVEMGMSICPVSSSTADNNGSTLSYESQSANEEPKPQPTIGVLCVKSTHQKQKIGSALIQKCEQIVQEVWKEHSIFVDVEPTNDRALAFFEKCGYKHLVDENGMQQTRETTVFRRRVQEVRLHWMLQKLLAPGNREGLQSGT